MSELMWAVFEDNRLKARFGLHEFVIMPDHVHLLLTPSYEISLEKCIQFVKGGFSYRAKKELGYVHEVWQKGFTEQRVKGTADYLSHVEYIHMNPVRRGLVSSPHEYPYSSANSRFKMEGCPDHLHG